MIDGFRSAATGPQAALVSFAIRFRGIVLPTWRRKGVVTAAGKSDDNADVAANESATPSGATVMRSCGRWYTSEISDAENRDTVST